MKKRKLGLVLLGFTLIASGCSKGGSSLPEQEDTQLEEVTVILDYVPNTNHTGMYVALEKGYYKEAGLDVKIIEPSEGATATLIAVGKGNFGVSYQEDVTIARTAEEPLPIRAIATVIQNNTSGFATYKDNNITSVKDFEGKTYAGWGGPGEEAVLKAVMDQAGADFNSLNRVISDGSGFSALKDHADIMWFYEGWDNVKCQMNDFEINYMPLRELDERLNFYTPVLITNEKMIQNQPEIVRKFLAATQRGYEDAIINPEESAKILHAYAPDYDLEMLMKSQEYLSAQYKGENARWGMMKDSVWDNYTAFLVEYGVIDTEVPAEECYTNAFLEDKE